MRHRRVINRRFKRFKFESIKRKDVKGLFKREKREKLPKFSKAGKEFWRLEDIKYFDKLDKQIKIEYYIARLCKEYWRVGVFRSIIVQNWVRQRAYYCLQREFSVLHRKLEIIKLFNVSFTKEDAEKGSEKYLKALAWAEQVFREEFQ